MLLLSSFSETFFWAGKPPSKKSRMTSQPPILFGRGKSPTQKRGGGGSSPPPLTILSCTPLLISQTNLFLYAAENSVYPWYITEKVFHGLAAGSVPVYIGDSVHLKHMAPPNSIIYADNFESVEALAMRVKYVVRDPALYEKYLEWQHQPDGVDNINRVLALELWKKEHGSEYACALCEFLHLVAGK